MFKNIAIICPSSLTKEKEIKSLCDDYIKRINSDVTIIEAKTKISQNDNDDLVKKKQGNAINQHLDKVPTNTAIIIMDERGRDLTSPQLAQNITKLQLDGYSSACKISFGNMVWPHRLVGLMLFEQLYRAQQINAGHPYHKA